VFCENYSRSYSFSSGVSCTRRGILEGVAQGTGKIRILQFFFSLSSWLSECARRKKALFLILKSQKLRHVREGFKGLPEDYRGGVSTQDVTILRSSHQPTKKHRLFSSRSF
jgi:hypothetical protein